MRSSSKLSSTGGGASARSARRLRLHAPGANDDRRTLGEAGGAIRNDDSLAARRRSRGRRVGSKLSRRGDVRSSSKLSSTEGGVGALGAAAAAARARRE